MKRLVIDLVVRLLICPVLALQPVPDKALPSVREVMTAPSLLALHNAARSQAGLLLLAVEPRLESAARAHALWMARRGRLAHAGIGNGDLWSRIRATGYTYTTASENIATGSPVPVGATWVGRRAVWSYRPWSESEAFASWMRSSGHRANVLDGRFLHVGFGMGESATGDRYYCAVYAAPSGGLDRD